MLQYLFVFFGLLAISQGRTSQTTKQSCKNVAVNWNEFGIPEAMTLNDFEARVVGENRTWTKIYEVMENPRPWKPYYNYEITYQMLSTNTYLERMIADNYAGEDTGNCVEQNFTLELMDTMPFQTVSRAKFTTQDKYMWIFKCTGGALTYCPKHGTTLDLVVPYRGRLTTMDNLPWESILRDLHKDANIPFGADDFSWSWTFGNNLTSLEYHCISHSTTTVTFFPGLQLLTPLMFTIIHQLVGDVFIRNLGGCFIVRQRSEFCN